jgi:hypothetical protein
MALLGVEYFRYCVDIGLSNFDGILPRHRHHRLQTVVALYPGLAHGNSTLPAIADALTAARPFFVARMKEVKRRSLELTRDYKPTQLLMSVPGVGVSRYRGRALPLRDAGRRATAVSHP